MMLTKKIAYLAPEIPSLSATFVINEIEEVERHGVEVCKFSVHQPTALPRHTNARNDVTYLYSKPLIGFYKALCFVWCHPLRFWGAFNWLCADLKSCGVSKNSLKLMYQFVIAARLAGDLLNSKCQHLHIHFAHVPTQIGMYAAKMSGITFSIMAHANDIFQRPLLLKQKAERAKVFFTISAFNRDYLLGMGLPAAKLDIIRCGIAIQPIVTIPEFNAKAVYRIGTLGRFIEKKGIDVLIKALSILNVQFPGKFQLSIAGTGPDQKVLSQLVESLNLGHLVDFVGPLKHSDVAAWMRQLDFFALACKVDSNGDMDGIPVALMEAMSQGLPVLSTKISGIPELVIHNQTGFLAEPGNANDLAAKINDAVSDVNHINQVIKASVSHACNEFSLTKNAQRLIERISH